MTCQRSARSGTWRVRPPQLVLPGGVLQDLTVVGGKTGAKQILLYINYFYSSGPQIFGDQFTIFYELSFIGFSLRFTALLNLGTARNFGITSKT